MQMYWWYKGGQTTDLDSRGISWNIVEFRGIPHVEFRGFSWNFVDFRGIS